MALDVGSVRIGVARSDPDGIMALPVETVLNNEKALATIDLLAAEYGCEVIYVGLPLNLLGEDTQSTTAARQFSSQLANHFHQQNRTVQIRLIDERLTTVSAQSALREAGVSQKNSRPMIDQAAAVVILEHALAQEKKNLKFAGTEVFAND